MNRPYLLSVVIPVYCDGARAKSAAESMLAQQLPVNCHCEVIVVDDGSIDETASVLASLDSRVGVFRLPENRGRSAARNAGAAASQGDGIVFMDCDCRPIDSHFLHAHVQELRSGAVATTGEVTGCDGAFWERYQKAASRRRGSQHAAGMAYAGSSQNLGVDRHAFELVGGFDVRYHHYGFEDRDLLLRLAEEGRVSWVVDATVRHLDALSLEQVTQKMCEAGGPSSARFAAKFPAAYAALGYARLDARLHPWLRPIARAFASLLRPASRMVDRLLPVRLLPYAFKAALVKTLTGLSFCMGTAMAASRSPKRQ